MSYKNSLYLKILLPVLTILILLIYFLFYHYSYSVEQIKNQAVRSGSNLLSHYIFQLNQEFNNISKYLAETGDMVNFYLDDLNNIDNGTGLRGIELGRPTFLENVFFIYSYRENHLLMVTNRGSSIDNRVLKEELRKLIEHKKVFSEDNWQLVSRQEEYGLINIIQNEGGFYTGVWLNIQSLLKPFKGFNPGYKGVIIFSDDGLPLASSFLSRESYIWINPNQVPGNHSTRTFTNPLNGQKYLLLKERMQAVPLNVIVMYSEQVILRDIKKFKWVLYVLIILTIFLILFLFSRFRNIIIKPIDRLSVAMRKVARGNFGGRVIEESSKEFNFLFHSFNNMVFDLNYLKIDYYEEELKLQEAELKYLQSQIKPHFFLNSLNIIYNLTAIKDYNSIKKMALYLGNYLHFTINNDKKLVTLEEELGHIRNYLEIQRLRFPDKIDYKIKIAPQHLSVMIPPLTIQPFVENSIIHGFKEKYTDYQIKVVVEEKAGGLLDIIIADNGSGFSRDHLRDFQQRKFGKTGGHIGIWNVYQRLNLCFKDNFDLKFFNSDRGGAVVKITIPWKKKEDKDV